MKKSFEINKKLENEIISSAYGDANIFVRIKIFILKLTYENVKQLYFEYENTASTINSFLKEKVDPQVIENTFAQIKLMENNSDVKNNIFANIVTKPAMAMSIIIAAAIIGFFVLINKPEQKQQYSKTEINNAKIQVEQTIKLISKVFKKTGNLLEEKVLPEEVGKPFNKGIDLINSYLQGG